MSYHHWLTNLSDATRALMQPDVLRIINNHLISGVIHVVEGRPDELLLKLDVKSGIDYVREDDTGLQGVAARVQWDDGRRGYPYNTFTIRAKTASGAKTELQKRLEQIEHGYIYPAFTLQAYFTNRQENELLSAAVIRTKTLYRLFQQRPDLFYKRQSDNVFFALPWRAVRKHIRMWQRPDMASERRFSAAWYMAPDRRKKRSNRHT